MLNITVADAQADLQRLISLAMQGEQIIISDDGNHHVLLQPIATESSPRRLGTGKGLLVYMADDFDKTPDEFQEHIE
ncbi:MAG: type II toxin-antitoxin system prevent-host-death family antitoxin [Chlorobi bacterium]|jgi:antitoxin (DNA-binding transcriptional repressor) of toxin-antitoxin stability system|nr:type II toxin-antitoxin system prevent-host-death family antitoxin [Chlorobiota bacterium]